MKKGVDITAASKTSHVDLGVDTHEDKTKSGKTVGTESCENVVT